MHWSKDVSLLFDPLRDVALRRDVGALRQILDEGSPSLSVAEYDNWNGGTTSYNLIIQIPVSIYATIEEDLEQIENQILTRIQRLQRDETNDFVTAVFVKPVADGAPRVIPTLESAYWLPSHFRLFISHLSQNKLQAHRLKLRLQDFGITSFVAHEDIQPTKEWQDEIEKALFSMDALAAILAPNFGSSKWTDHEVGLALGRGQLVWRQL